VHLELGHAASGQERECGLSRFELSSSRVSRRLVAVAASAASGWPTKVTGRPAAAYSGGSKGNNASNRSAECAIAPMRSRRHAQTDGLT